MLSKKDFTSKLARNIKMAREKTEMSQEELAHKAELYRTYVNHIESSRYSPSAYVIYKIAKVLGISTSEILPQ